MGVLPQRQGLALGLEASDHLLGIHAELDDLQGDGAPQRLGLLGQVHIAERALADQAQQLVGPDPVADLLAGLRAA